MKGLSFPTKDLSLQLDDNHDDDDNDDNDDHDDEDGDHDHVKSCAGGHWWEWSPMASGVPGQAMLGSMPVCQTIFHGSTPMWR